MKIRIKKVDPEIMTQKGLFGDGCYGSRCEDECCEWGCDVDFESYLLIKKYRHLIEPLIKARIEDCFATGIIKDNDYLGGAYRETVVRESDNRCAFHLIGRKGCSLFYLWAKKGLPKRIIPTICRTYPITWHRGKLFVDRPLKRACKCMERTPRGEKVPSLYETQRRDIWALFDIQDKKFLASLKNAKWRKTASKR